MMKLTAMLDGRPMMEIVIMIEYRKAFPNENIYIHNPNDYPPSGESSPQRKRYRYAYIWRALTPTGKVSKYYHAELSNRWRDHSFYELPKLRKGYEWKGPYLYGKYQTWNDGECENE